MILKTNELKKEKKNTLDELIKEAKKDENWNNYQNLKNLLKQIKKLQFSDLYKKNKSEIYAIESRLKELNPDNFRDSIKNDLDEKVKSCGLSQEEISDETKKLVEEAIQSGEIDKKKKAEESIIQEGADKKLNEIISLVKEKIVNKSDLTKDQKEELITKILEVISANSYQKNAYQKQKKKVDMLLSTLRGGEEDQENSEFSWPEKLVIAAVISLIVTILVSVIMKINARRKLKKVKY